MAESGLPHGIRAAQLHAKALQEQLSPAQHPAINRARTRLTSLMLGAWIGSAGDPKGVAPDVAAQSSRRLASAAARGGIATLEQEAAKLKARKADPAEVEYIQSVVSLVKTHLPTELDVGVTAKPSPAPVNAEPTTTPPAGSGQQQIGQIRSAPKLSDLVPGYSTPKVSHQSHGELELVAAEAIKSTEDIRHGIRAARRYAEILKQELPPHEHSGVDTAVNWLTADILHAAAKYTFGAPGWFPEGMGASDLYDLAQAAGHGGLSGLEQKAQELSTSASKATGIQEAVNTIKNFMPDIGPAAATPTEAQGIGALAQTLQSVIEKKAAPEPVTASVPLAAPPIISHLPLDKNGKPNISAANVNKLHKEAAFGDVAALEVLGQELQDNLQSMTKKAAIAAAVSDLKSQMTAFEGAQAIAIGSQASAQAYNPATPGADEQTTVNSDPEKGPANSAAKAANIIELQSLLKSVAELKSQEPSSEAETQKDWNAVLEPVSGPKGSNQGGLFKDQQTGALHYVKWSGSDVKPKVEVLAGALYALADVPVPGLRVIDYQGQTAVMSDWIDGAKPMTIDNMKGHPDVRENFVVDAWLANWDVIGLSADNIVLGPDGKAYRIDAGGSLLFRAQGKPKWFPPFVEEHKTLLDKGKNPNSAKVFEGLTNEELMAGAEKVASVTDSQIDDVVDALDLPKTSKDFGDSDDIPMLLKWSLKKRRDYLVSEIEKQVGQTTPAPVQETGTSTGVPASPSVATPAPPVWTEPEVQPLSPEGLEAYAELEQVLKSGPQLDNPTAAIQAIQKHAAVMTGSGFAHNPDAVSSAAKWLTTSVIFEAVKASFDGVGQYGDQSGYPEGLDTDDLRALVTAAGHKGETGLQHKAGALATNPVKGAAVQQVVDTIKGILPDTDPPAAEIPASGQSPQSAPPTATTMPNVSATNQKKLEKAAASGDAQLLEETGMKLSAALKSQGKKAAIANAVANLKAQIQGMVEQAAENDTGMSEAVENVSDGDVRLPRQSVPDPAVVEKQADLQGSGKKDYDADLELVGGKKGSTQGSLFKDQHLDTLHYVKWNNSEVRAKVEALTGALYALADVPVPIQRVIDFKGETAVMSDWLDDAVPMSMEDLKSHPDVLENFAVDAWLANWDVVGTNGVNIVKGPGGKAYRVDLGGALLFRALGDAKKLPAEVSELTLLQDSGKNPMSAQVFADLTDEQLKAGAEKVGKISDQQIDDAVDKLDIPKESPQYKDSKNLPMFLKKRLKERRDYVAKEVLNILDLKKQKADAVKQQLDQLEETSDLKPETLSVVLEHAPKMKLMMDHKQRRAIQDEVLTTELGKTKGKNASGAVSSTYNGWKGWADTPAGRLLRWASGEIDGTGDRELRRIQAFNEFMVGKHEMSPTKSASQITEVKDAAASAKGANLAEGLKVTRKANRVASVIQNPGQDRITLYRGWKPVQVEYLQLQDAQVGDTFALDDPPVYSWSVDLSTAKSFGHGSIVTKAEVPIDRLILTDRMNNTGSHAGENEVLFKGGDAQQMEVLYKY